MRKLLSFPGSISRYVSVIVKLLHVVGVKRLLKQENGNQETTQRLRIAYCSFKKLNDLSGSESCTFYIHCDAEAAAECSRAKGD